MPLLPTAFQRSLVRRTKELLVATNRHPVSRFVGVQAYNVMRAVITTRFRAVEGVRAVYLCHSLAAGECYPGLTDFDIAIVFESGDPLTFYERIRREWGNLKRYFPISDLSLLTVDEFEAWQTRGGGWDPLDEVRHWKLLAGEDLRHEQVDLQSTAAALDRMQWALGHFQNLLSVAIKEETQSSLMALVARRQVHKCFWNAVLALDSSHLQIPTHRERVAAWIRQNGEPAPVRALQDMYECRFLSGPVTIVRFAAAALAYRLLDAALAVNPLLARPLARPIANGEDRPIANLRAVEERARTMCASVLEMLASSVASIMLSSTGTARGFAFYIVLRDGLSDTEIAAAIRDVRAIHRVFDDPWFNEHFPAGIPTVCSRRMFLARLQTGRSSLHYFEKFRLVLYGADLYAECLSASGDPNDGASVRAARISDWAREHLLYSLHLHQIYLASLKPALHDYITFYLPRLMLQLHTDTAPATAEEAAAVYASLTHGVAIELPLRMLDEYRGKDLDVLLRTMPLSAFRDAWPLLRQGLLPAAVPA